MHYSAENSEKFIQYVNLYNPPNDELKYMIRSMKHKQEEIEIWKYE